MRKEDYTWLSKWSEFRSYFLVGDSFKAQIDDPRLVTIRELDSFLTYAAAHRNIAPSFVITLGQGISDEQLVQTCQYIKELGLEEHIRFHPHSFEKHATSQLTHKQIESNILITDPTFEDGCYFSSLKVDEKCDDIHDHLTGKHLPGMLLIEAARQMVLAISEKFIVGPSYIGKAAYITHKQNMEFRNFMFPLGVDIQAHIHKIRKTGNINFQAVMFIDFIQGNIYGASCEFHLSGLDKTIIQQQEAKQAVIAIEHELARLQSTARSPTTCDEITEP